MLRTALLRPLFVPLDVRLCHSRSSALETLEKVLELERRFD